ncbi:MAG: CPBP family intramembrane metalloprotease [Spirochaetales bacterium]|nr:CPBP family intramembrane metalloprotease [Spirochaetales bacterium]
MTPNIKQTKLPVLLIALFLPAVITTIYMLFLKDTVWGNILMIFQIVWLAGWPLLRGQPSQIITEIKNCKKKIQSIAAGIISGIILFGVLFAGYQFFKNDLLQYASRGYGEADLAALRQLFFVYALFGCVFNTLIEELYWRRFVFGKLEQKTNTIVAAVVSAICFGIHHYIMLVFIFSLFYVLLIGTLIVVAGFIWNILFSKYKTIIPGWISHAFVVAMLMIVIADVVYEQGIIDI